MARPKTTGKYRTRRQLEKIIHILDCEGYAHIKIARACGVDPRTVRNILGDCYVGGRQERYATPNN